MAKSTRTNPQPIPKFRAGDLLLVSSYGEKEPTLLVWVTKRKWQAKIYFHAADRPYLARDLPIGKVILLTRDCEWTFHGNLGNVEKFDE